MGKDRERRDRSAMNEGLQDEKKMKGDMLGTGNGESNLVKWKGKRSEGERRKGMR